MPPCVCVEAMFCHWPAMTSACQSLRNSSVWRVPSGHPCWFSLTSCLAAFNVAPNYMEKLHGKGFPHDALPFRLLHGFYSDFPSVDLASIMDMIWRDHFHSLLRLSKHIRLRTTMITKITATTAEFWCGDIHWMNHGMYSGRLMSVLLPTLI